MFLLHSDGKIPVSYILLKRTLKMVKIVQCYFDNLNALLLTSYMRYNAPSLEKDGSVPPIGMSCQ